MIEPARRRIAKPLVAATLLATLIPARAEVVISQIYGGGGNSGAPYRNDFVELFNRGTNAVSLAGWTVQYASSAGANWQTALLSGDLQPGRHFLLQLGSGGANGNPLPQPDEIGGINLAAGSGKIALVSSSTPLSGSCPTGDTVADLAGYGTAASCFEGSGPAPAGANAVAVLRASGGCTDGNDNASDFFTGTPAPRNRQSPAIDCSGQDDAVALHTIQGNGSSSILAGQSVVTTTNIVTAVRADGFFLQALDSQTDADADTSEAIFVSAPDALPPLAVVGNAVVTSGIVQEFRPAGNPAVPPQTRLINATLSLVATGQPLPAPILLVPTALAPTGGPEQLEKYESMRLRINSLRVVGATEGFLIESSASGISDGVFYGVLPGVSRPFREPGIPLLDPLPPEAPPGVPRFDGNPERLRVDSNAQPGAPRIEVTAGANVNGLVGVLDFGQQTWTLLPDVNSSPSVSGNRGAVPVPPAGSNEFTVASFNLERFFDTIDDPAVSESVLTTDAFNGRLNKASLAVRNVLRAPDILGLVEIENLSTLQALASKVNGDAAAAGQSNVVYAAWLEEGNDIGGIDCGFLVNTTRVAVLDVTQFGKDTTYVNPLNGQPETLNDRPPLVLRGFVERPGTTAPFPVTVILNHLRSLNNIDDPAEGARIRAKRRAQAEYLAGLIQERQAVVPPENLVIIGDFNAFPFNDGYVDSMSIIKGSPASADVVTLAGADLVNPDLINLTDTLPLSERYSYSFNGNAQAIDHILVNNDMLPRLVRYGYARNGVDYPESMRSNFNRPERISDHDAPVAAFMVALPPRIISIRTISGGGVELQFQAEPLQELRVESSIDLIQWSGIGIITTDANGRASFAQPAGLAPPHRFYRIAVP